MTKTEHRIVCRLFGKKGLGNFHTNHVWLKRDKKKAIQSLIDLTHHADTVSQDHFYKREAPYRRQEREVTEWEDTE
jgi:hypothetical protein